MATVMWIGALRVVVYSNDHRPAHVHVIGSNGEAAFWLQCPKGPPKLRQCYGLTRKEVGSIKKALDKNLEELCSRWRKVHGDF